MIYKALVVAVNDPDNYGRIKAKVASFEAGQNVSPWAWPVMPMAGTNYGFFRLPEIGDEVMMVQAADGDWMYLGFFWTGRNPLPTGMTPEKFMIVTPAGHQCIMDDNGDVDLVHSNGSKISISAGGDINIESTGNVQVTGDNIELNGTDGKVVTTAHICAYTGAPHPQGSLTVKAKQ
jgi:uncharacterized protein involved in type VI secretion and phage assembly